MILAAKRAFSLLLPTRPQIDIADSSLLTPNKLAAGLKSILALHKLPHADTEIERELRFLMPISAFRSITNWPAFVTAEITQHHFSEQQQSALSKALPKSIASRMYPQELMKSCRIRHTRSENADDYALHTKSKKEMLLSIKCKRDEHSLALNEELYTALSQLPADSSIHKARRICHGQVLLERGKTAPLELHLDQIIAAGKRDSSGTIPLVAEFNLPYLIAELEFQDDSHLPYILKGQHTLSGILNHCIMISGNNQLEKALSTKKLAGNGISEGLLDQLNSLEFAA